MSGEHHLHELVCLIRQYSEAVVIHSLSDILLSLLTQIVYEMHVCLLGVFVR